MGLLLLSLTAVACGGPAGPHVHVASANHADLLAVQDEDVIWYEFREGDIVPFRFLMIGVAVAGGEPVRLKATKNFWIVMRKNLPMEISFDGKNFTPHKIELVAAVAPGEGDQAQLMWLNYIGEGDASDELEKISQQSEPNAHVPEETTNIPARAADVTETPTKPSE